MEVDAVLKKVPGVLSIEEKFARWAAKDGSSTIQLMFNEVKAMQASPPTAAKRRIKITSSDDSSIVLEFADLESLDKTRDGLQAAIKASKMTPAPEEPSAKARPAAPRESTPSKKNTEKQLEPGRLLQNLDLQRKILKNNRELARAFQQTVVSGSLSNDQFWAMRIELLLTSAQESLQARGSYNVLSTIKPVTGSDNKVNISLTREKIGDMFDQYPIVRKAYNDTVPSKLSEGLFWQRFFMSRLFLTLRGETISQNHAHDAVLDRYIDVLNEHRKRQKLGIQEGDYVVGALNVEGNAENNPETYGNRPDKTMRFDMSGSGKDTAGLIRSMNGLSKRLLAGRKRTAQHKLSEKQADKFYEEQRLSDLEKPAEDTSSIPLNVDVEEQNPADAAETHVDSSVREKFGKDLEIIQIGDVASYEEAQAAAQTRLDELIDGIYEVSEAESSGARVIENDTIALVHITTLEFLRQFWRASLADEPVEGLKENLVKSLERIKAVAADGTSIVALEPLQRACNICLSK